MCNMCVQFGTTKINTAGSENDQFMCGPTEDGAGASGLYVGDFPEYYGLGGFYPYFFNTPPIFRWLMEKLTTTEKEPDLQQALPAEQTSLLSIEHYAGNVTVKGDDTETVRVAARNRDVGLTCKTEVTSSEGKIVVTTSKAFFDPSSCEVDMDILVPRRMSINGKVLKGNLNIMNIAGDLHVTMGLGTFSGRVQSQQTYVKMGMGHLNLRWLSLPPKGRVDIEAGVGDVLLEFPRGSVIDAEFEGGISKVTNEVETSSEAGMKLSAKTGLSKFRIYSY